MSKTTTIEKNYFTTDDIVNWWDPEGSKASFSEYLGTSNKLEELHASVLSDLLKNLDFNNKKILDAGVGKGRFAVNIAQNGGGDITGLDMNKKMLLLTRERIEKTGLDKVKLVQGDIEQMPLADHKFDVVCCMETLIHVPDLSKAIKEFSRILKKDGKLAVNVQTNTSYLGYVEYYGLTNIIRGFYNLLRQRLVAGKKNHTHLISRKSFERMLLDSGFSIDKKIYYGKYFTVLTTYICTKDGSVD